LHFEVTTASKPFIGEGIPYVIDQYTVTLPNGGLPKADKDTLPLNKSVVSFPQADAEGFVHSSINPSLEVVSASLDDVHVEATPTLLLVDAHGKVEKSWVGQLDDSGQKQVQSQL
jgi:hypothetical protein